MDYQFEMEWQNTLKKMEQMGFDGVRDLDAVLFLIGVQECGFGYRQYKKDEKLQLIHVAVCRLLEPYGYYEYEGLDEDGWPHFVKIKSLPALEAKDQERLMKEAVIAYFGDY